MKDFPVKREVSEPGSMLVIHQGALGDFILALPALIALKKAFPGTRTTIMGYPRILQIAEGRFYAEEIYSIDQKGLASFFVRQGPLDPGMVRFFSSFGLVAVFGKDEEGALIGNLKRVCLGPVLHIQSLPGWNEGVHLSDHLLNQLARYGVPPSERNPNLFLRESDREWGMNFWNTRGINPERRSEAIVLHPGSGSKKKVWPLHLFQTLYHRLETRHRGAYLVVFGPAEGPEVQRPFEKLASPHLVPAKGLSLVQLASVMEGCRLFIGNDSGISHMAAALGLPTVAVFGPTDCRVWAPRGEKVEIVRREIPCSPCSEERFFLCKEAECLSRVEIEDVLGKVVKLGVEV